MRRSTILVFSLAMILCFTGPSFADTFTHTQALDIIIGEGPLASLAWGDSFTYTHLTPADFEVPYDIVNSASLTISGYWIDGDNDYVSISGTVYGHLESGGEYDYDWSWSSWSWVLDYDTPSESTISIAGAFSTWSTGSPLEVTITANGELGDGIIELSSSLFTLDYDNETAPTNPVPEPATMLLMGTGLVGMVVVSRRKRFYKKG